MQKELYEEHISKLKPGAECVISFGPCKETFYEVKEISFPGLNKQAYSLLPGLY